ncbi:MAG: hypothetical protein U0U69_05100 [Acidimicrobiia bacterium]
MGTGRRQGRPEASAAEIAGACAQLVEAVRYGEAGAFTEAAGHWCDAVLTDAGWAVWVWRAGAGFELRAGGGQPPPPRSDLAAVSAALETDATRRELAPGRPVLLGEVSTGPGTSAAAVAFGTPSRLLAVLAVFRPGPPAVVTPRDMDSLAVAARLCASVIDDAEQHRPPTQGPPLGPALLAELGDEIAVITGAARTLIRSEHRLGRVDRHRYHEVIERQALSLAGAVDDIARVTGVPAATSSATAPAPVPPRQFTDMVVDSLGPGVELAVDPAVEGAVPRGADASDLAAVVAGLARVVGATGSRVTVGAATSDTYGRVGVAAVVGAQEAARLDALVRAVAAGGEDVVLSGRAPLAIAAATAVARGHGGAIGAAADGEAVRIWLDLPLRGAAP